MEITLSKKTILKGSLALSPGSDYSSSNFIVNALQSEIPPFEGHCHLVPLRNDLRRDLSGDHLEVSGKIYYFNRLKSLKNVSVEIWHLSPSSKEFLYRARFQTDDSGFYRFYTDYPGREMGKNYKIYFKIFYKKHQYFTALSFNHCSMYVAGRLQEKKESLQKTSKLPVNKPTHVKSRINFNISINKN